MVVGLGNPGAQYAATRHNAGFLAVERLADRHGAPAWERSCHSQTTRVRLEGRAVVLARPQTYMNRSGPAVAALLHRLGLGPEGLVVVHDDLDLPFGTLRIRQGGGHGGHNGVRSIIEALEARDFVRLKIGLGRPPGDVDPADYVLSPFDPDEKAVLSGLLDRAAEALESIVVEGPLRAMNRIHS
ncbi:MAG: aminoacyl-tRNA hydrolase [Deferrisomatales bacterium]